MSTEWPEGFFKRVLPSVDSTNAEASRVARHLSGPTWILAHEQTAARGRRGRAWINPHGNFAATLVLTLHEPVAQIALRSFVMALALQDALATATGRGEAFNLKWPNDVLLNGGKLAGILLESTSAAKGSCHLFIGVGVNLVAAPEQSDLEEGAMRPISLMSELGVRISPEDFLTYLAAAYAQREASLLVHGFGPIREAWLQNAARLGETITARMPSDATTGVFETIDDAGQLVLSTPKGRVSIPAADVYFQE